MKLLLFSNSTNYGEGFLEYPIPYIQKFLQTTPKSKELLFVPFAAVSFAYEEFLSKVREKIQPLGFTVKSVDTIKDIKQALDDAGAIIVGGGNTFHLLYELQNRNLLNLIRKYVKNGLPYIGWSAGANVVCPTIKTTNDMPIIQPQSFEALNLIPFQINPHYIDANPANHAGETREARIMEFIEVNKKTLVVGLREGSSLSIESDHIVLQGKRTIRIFQYGETPYELTYSDDLDFLLKS